MKQEDDYRRHSIAEEHDGSQTPASYPHTPQHRAETPQTPEFNLAQRAAEAAQQGYSLVTAHSHHPQEQSLKVFFFLFTTVKLK